MFEQKSVMVVYVIRGSGEVKTSWNCCGRMGTWLCKAKIKGHLRDLIISVAVGLPLREGFQLNNNPVLEILDLWKTIP